MLHDESLKFKKWLMLRLWMEGRSAWSVVWVRWSQATRERTEQRKCTMKRWDEQRERGRGKGCGGPRGPSELASVYNCRRQNQLCINLDASHEHVLQRRADTVIPPLHCRCCSFCAALLPPFDLSDYSFFKKQTSPWWAEFINKFGFDCVHQSPPIMSWFVYILAH